VFDIDQAEDNDKADDYIFSRGIHLYGRIRAYGTVTGVKLWWAPATKAESGGYAIYGY
jgi:hypothetical protein